MATQRVSNAGPRELKEVEVEFIRLAQRQSRNLQQNYPFANRSLVDETALELLKLTVEASQAVGRGLSRDTVRSVNRLRFIISLNNEYERISISIIRVGFPIGQTIQEALLGCQEAILREGYSTAEQPILNVTASAFKDLNSDLETGKLTSADYIARANKLLEHLREDENPLVHDKLVMLERLLRAGPPS